MHVYRQLRRGRFATTAILAMGVLVAACGSDAGTSSSETVTDTASEVASPSTTGSTSEAEGDSGDPLRVGILAPYSGVFADFGPNVIEAPIQLYLDTHDGQLGGREVETVVADTQSDPTVALERAEQLVEQDEVDVIVGLVNSSGALAVRDYLDETQTPTIITVAGASELTQDRKSEYIFRVSFANGQTEAAGAVLAREALGLESMAGIGADYVAGHQLLEKLLGDFEELGGEVPLTVWPPLGNADFSSYIADLQRVSGEVDAISPMLFGADAVRFFGQYQEFGVETPIYAFGDVTEQTVVLDQIPGQAVGAQTYWTYSPYLENEANTEFRAAYLDAFDRLPGAFSFHAYAAMQFLDAAVQELGGSWESADDLVSALEQAVISSPGGELRFDEDHGVIFDVYLMEINEGPDGIVAQMPVGPMVSDVDQYQTVDEALENYSE